MAGESQRNTNFGSDDQDRLLDEATAVVKEQAFYMKRAIDNDNVREALKHASNLICELRTSQLSPKNYYELYMQVFQEMQHLAGFFGDKARHGRKMVDLYESVQHAGNILPRLYLLVTVGSSYIKSMEAPAKDILKDVNELCKGIQHPLRGLFLRYYLSQMLKDKLPDAGSGYEGEGGDINDAFEFLFTNFNESNRLWVRIQNQGPVKDKTKREKERHDLRVLVGANLVRLSQLEGMTVDFYAQTALPKILEHIVSVKDQMSQQYLFESMIQVFPDEFHIRTIEQMLESYAKALPAVDMKPIMVTLLNRLANYMNDGESGGSIGNIDIFSLFQSHLRAILERALEPANAGATPGTPDISGPLEVQAAFLQFIISLYPDKVHYVDIILDATVDLLKKYFTRLGDGTEKLSGPGAEKVVDLLSLPLKSLSLSVLTMEHYPKLMGVLNFTTRKQVAMSIISIVTEDENTVIDNVDTINSLFGFISSLIKDEDDTPNDEGKDKQQFALEQQKVCQLVHLARNDDSDIEYDMVLAMRGHFGSGGEKRLVHTLQPIFYRAMSLIPKIQERERRRAEEGEDGPAAPRISVKKVFQFMHKTNTALQTHAPLTALHMWLVAASTADQVDQTAPGTFEPICFEFLTQALIVFEEEIPEAAKQYTVVFPLVGTIVKLSCLEADNFQTTSMKVVQHAARILKKPLQVRAVAAGSHLYWCDAQKDGKRVLECLQKCLKTTDAIVQSDPKQVGLWVEMLDNYVYYAENGTEEVTVKFIASLLNLCNEHIDYSVKEPSASKEGKEAKAHLKQTCNYLRSLKKSSNAEIAAVFAELEDSALVVN